MKKMQMIGVFCWIMGFLLLAAPALDGQAVEAKAAKPDAGGKLININTAAVLDLVTLPRIGQKTAERIVQYRKDNGNFKRKQDLMKVKGIGEKLFAQLEQRITI